jgi:hypothetical protein
METLIDELPPVSRPTEVSKSGANKNKGRKIVYNTVTNWGMLCREKMSVFLEDCSEKIGGRNKTVEIDESKFGQR